MPLSGKKHLVVGVLAFHGDVEEHMRALRDASRKTKIPVTPRYVRIKEDLKGLHGVILPGGESTTLEKLVRRAGMVPQLMRIKGVFGTCAGAILMSKKAAGATRGQETFSMMDIEVDRNAYGTQKDSFEADIDTELGRVHAIFIRAPRITKKGKGVRVLAERQKEVIACEEKRGSRYYLAAAFHPELTSTVFHERFLQSIS